MEKMNSPPAETNTSENDKSLEDLVCEFKYNISKSNWLKENTSTKWLCDNPKVASEYFKVYNSENKSEADKTITKTVSDGCGNEGSSLEDSLVSLKDKINSTGWLSDHNVAKNE